MKPITSKQVGRGLLSPAQTIATILAVVGWAACMIIMVLIGCPWWVMIVALALLGAVLGSAACVFIFDVERFERTIIWIRYFARAFLGKTITHQLTIDMKSVRKRVPINTIHDDGLIEYSVPKNQYGVLFRYDPAENRKEGTDKTKARIEKIIHTLSTDLWVSFHFSHIQDTSTAVEDNLLAAINHPNATMPQKEHLLGLYDYITEAAEDRTVTAFLMSVRLGTFKNAKVAGSAYRSNVPVFLKLLHEAGIYARLLTTEDEIVGELAQFAVLEGTIK